MQPAVAEQQPVRALGATAGQSKAKVRSPADIVEKLFFEGQSKILKAAGEEAGKSAGDPPRVTQVD